MRQTGLTDLDWEVVMVYAENDMNAWQTARQLCLSSSGVAYHLDKVRDAKIIPQEGDKGYIELKDGLRLIFVHGKYVGFYTQEPKV